MDRGTYDPTIEPASDPGSLAPRVGGPDRALARRGRGPTRLCGHAAVCRDVLGRDAPRIGVAGAVDGDVVADPCVRGSRSRSKRSHRLFPDALDYVDVYDRAGGLGERTVLAHAIHLSDRELARLVETGTRVAHCPASNLFIGVGGDAAGAVPRGGICRRARVRRVGRPGRCRSSRSMRVGAYAQMARAVARGRRAGRSSGRSTGSGWERSTARGPSGSTTRSGRSRRARTPTSSPSTRRSSAPCPAGRRRARGPGEPSHLPGPPRHGPRRVGPGASARRSGKSSLSRGRPYDVDRWPAFRPRDASTANVAFIPNR